MNSRGCCKIFYFFEGNRAVFNICWTPHKFTLLTSDCTTFFSVMSLLCETGLSAITVTKSKYPVQSNIEQETRMAILTLIPRCLFFFFLL